MKSVLDEIKTIEELPTLPAVAMEAMTLAHSPDVTIEKLSEVIHRDPPLAAKMLKLANSSYYRRSNRQIETIQRAISILGLSEIVNITSSVSVLSSFAGHKGVLEAFWDHCVATAIIARTMARILHISTNGREFVAGLLHDIGKIVLDQYFHEDFLKALELSEQRGCSLYETEIEILGATHMEVGQVLAQRWNLPSFLVDVISWHHDPNQAEFKDLSALISIADLLAKAKELSYGGDKMSFVLSDQPGWDVLSQHGYDMDSLDLERITFEMDDLGERVRDYIKSVMD